jgi:hypothetical protein
MIALMWLLQPSTRALKERHWQKVYEAIDVELPQDDTFTLEVCHQCQCVGRHLH